MRNNFKKLSTLIIGTFMAFQSQSMEPERNNCSNDVEKDRTSELCDLGEQYFKGLLRIKSKCGTMYECGKCSYCKPPIIENIHYNPTFAEETKDLTPKALYELYESTKETNEVKAIHCLALSASMGYNEAEYTLGRQYYHVHMEKNQYQSIMKLYDEPKDFYIAFYFFHKAADGGNVVAQCCLGQVYFRGGWTNGRPILKPNYEKAYQYFSIAAAQNWTEAKFMLGRMYHEELYVTKDLNTAYDYFIASYNETEDPRLKKLSEEGISQIKEERELNENPGTLESLTPSH